jgi:glutaredoxin-dependent peroxiredoxin
MRLDRDWDGWPWLQPKLKRKPFDRGHTVSILISLAQPKPETFMALAIGTTAPDFSLPTKTAEGPKQIKLSDNFGKMNTVLLFFPMAFTGTCTTEMCGISQELNAYGELNANVCGISGDNPFAQEAWAQKEKIAVPLLSDYEHKVAKAYDVMYDSFLPQMNLGMGGVAKRSAFIVDKNGVIQYAESHDDARELPDFEKIKAKLASLK